MKLDHESLRIARDELVVVPETDQGSIPAFVDRFRAMQNPSPIEYADHLRKLVTAIIQKMEFAFASGLPALQPLYFHACRINDMRESERVVWENTLDYIVKELHAQGWSKASADHVEWQSAQDEGTEQCEQLLVIGLSM